VSPKGNNNETVGTTTPCTTPFATQQSTLVSAKDVDPKAVTWIDITIDNRMSMKAGETGQILKSALTICGIDAMQFNMEQL
jgi:hypothetical protein